MGELTFILGGAGSGKSRFAVEMAKGSSGPVVFVATCKSMDKEMERKIENHRKERPAQWEIIEAASTPFNINGFKKKAECLLVDSLTLWVSALLLRRDGRERTAEDCRAFLKKVRADFKHTIIVSDEVGFGVVPENRLARDFREILGIINQEAAKAADEVFLVAAGLPVQLKNNKSKRRTK